MRAEERVDVMFQNIKRAFFQPAENVCALMSEA